MGLNKILEKVMEDGHFVKDRSELPVRGDQVYEEMPYSPRSIVSLYVFSALSSRPIDHWFTDGKEIYILEDLANQRRAYSIDEGVASILDLAEKDPVVMPLYYKSSNVGSYLKEFSGKLDDKYRTIDYPSLLEQEKRVSSKVHRSKDKLSAIFKAAENDGDPELKEYIEKLENRLSRYSTGNLDKPRLK